LSEVSTQSDLGDKPVTTTSGMTTKVVKGSFWLLAGQVLPLIATFISTPFVIRSLGSEAYGALLVVGLVSSYVSFADFGMGLSSTKFGSEAYAEGNRKKEAVIIHTAGMIALLSSLLIALPIFFFSDIIVGDLLNIPSSLLQKASVSLKITAVAFVVTILASVLNTPQLARMKMNLNVMINAGSKVLMILVTPFVLFFGGGIVEATLVALATAVVALIANILVSSRLLPELFSISISKRTANQLVKFGGNVVLYSIGLTLINYLERFILAKLVSVQSVAYYSVAATFALMMSMISMAMVQTLMPAFSQLLTPEKKSQLNSLFSRTLRFSFIAAIPAMMILLTIAKPFFTLWAGNEFGRESVYPFYILLVGVFFGISSYIPNCILVASGQPRLFAKFYLFELVPYGVLAFFLVKQFGIIGAAITFSIRETVNSLVFIKLAQKKTGIAYDIHEHIYHYLLGFLIFLPAVVAGIAGVELLLLLFAFLPFCIAAYTLFVWKKLISGEERKWIKSKLTFLRLS